MKKTKKLIALALALVMCLGALPLSASAAGGTYTVTFDVETYPPIEHVNSWPSPITVTNGDKWDLKKPIWFTAAGLDIIWCDENLDPIVNGTVINLSSDITVYAVMSMHANKPGSTASQNNNNQYQGTGPASKTKDDISATASAWAQASVAEAVKLGLVPDNRISFQAGNLGGSISRVNFCELIAKLVEAKTGIDITAYAESQGKTVGGHFIDSEGYPAIEAAYALGIVNGVSENTFGAGNNITRQEAAAMLERAAKVLGISSSGAGMTFSDGVADWAKGSVAFVSGLVDPVSGSPVMGGVGNGRFDPTGKYTNEQAIVTVLRLYHCA